jgi:diguanylate cyclase (GGDEF)-like protein
MSWRDICFWRRHMKTVRAPGRAHIQLAQGGRAGSAAASKTEPPASTAWRRSRDRKDRTGSYSAVANEPDRSDPSSQTDLVKDLQRENARLRRALAELEGYRNLAYRDTLTGLWNRLYFEERLSEEISLGSRKAWRRFSLLALDINDLKRVNDYEGHAAGDQMIKRAGDFLKTRLREHDVLCRTGGDEFVVILRELGTSETAQLLARLRPELRAFNGRSPNQLSLAIGAASFPEDSSSGPELCRRADERMYADKRRQKDLPEPDPESREGS